MKFIKGKLKKNTNYMRVVRAELKRPFQDASNTPPPNVTTTCHRVYGIYYPFWILLRMNSINSAVKEQRTGICTALVSVESLG